jgi:beta-phosphoglucomutase-like phosphatase (HAD superfamily)
VAARGLPGKPAPDAYLLGAELLGVDASKAIVVEDAVSGVAAGAAGHFAVVIGVDRGAGHDTLLSHGADIVVDDLSELLPDAVSPDSVPPDSVPPDSGPIVAP